MSKKVTSVEIINGVVKINGIVQNCPAGNTIEIDGSVVKIDGVIQKIVEHDRKSEWQRFWSWIFG